MTKVLLPDPDTPVTKINLPNLLDLTLLILALSLPKRIKSSFVYPCFLPISTMLFFFAFLEISISVIPSPRKANYTILIIISKVLNPFKLII